MVLHYDEDFLDRNYIRHVLFRMTSTFVRSDAMRFVSFRIKTGITSFTADTLIQIKEKLAYRLHMCRVPNGAHIKHLKGKQKQF